MRPAAARRAQVGAVVELMASTRAALACRLTQSQSACTALAGELSRQRALCALCAPGPPCRRRPAPHPTPCIQRAPDLRWLAARAVLLPHMQGSVPWSGSTAVNSGGALRAGRRRRAARARRSRRWRLQRSGRPSAARGPPHRRGPCCRASRTARRTWRRRRLRQPPAAPRWAPSPRVVCQWGALLSGPSGTPAGQSSLEGVHGLPKNEFCLGA